MQEIEKETWDNVARRVQGANTVKQLKKDSYSVKELPPMFDDWVEYRDYLLENLVTGDIKEKFKKEFEYIDSAFSNTKVYKEGVKTCITALLKNDYHMTVIRNYKTRPAVFKYNKNKKYEFKREHFKRV